MRQTSIKCVTFTKNVIECTVYMVTNVCVLTEAEWWRGHDDAHGSASPAASCVPPSADVPTQGPLYPGRHPAGGPQWP